MDDNTNLRPGAANAFVASTEAESFLRILGDELVLLVYWIGRTVSELRLWGDLLTFAPWFMFEEQLHVGLVVDDESAKERAQRDERIPDLPILTSHDAAAVDELPQPGDLDEPGFAVVLVDQSLSVRFLSHSLASDEIIRLRETINETRHRSTGSDFEVSQ